jgi:Protein kinase domain/WD40-like Beta Propeller Repeat
VRFGAPRIPKLGRDVAIKILPASFAHDPERMVRFEREAKVLASLNYRNVAQIYAIEDGAIVMELVEGETLKGPLPLDTALDYARQIADALEAAHDKGIVHRDLKPGNIIVPPNGVVKVLDFGLARIAEEPAEGGGSEAPTRTISPTRAGVVLGTAAYLSPEQARGKPVDKRADIWAFGCVLYEMLTGEPAFAGETTTDILAAVGQTEPDLSRVPAQVRRLLRSCLMKNPKQRLQAIGDWRLLEDADVNHRPEGTALSRSRRGSAGWFAAAALTIIAAATSWIAWRATRPADHPLVRLNVDLGPDAVTGNRITAAISPDGSRLAFPVRGSEGTPQLATRLLAQPQATVLAGTDNASDPFFSPDSQWIGFFSGGKLKKVSVHGGTVVTLCDAPNGRGAAWGDDGRIIATLDSTSGFGLSRVPAGGGSPERLTKPADQKDDSHRWPQILPGGHAVLFTASNVVDDYENGSLDVVSLKTGQVKVLLQDIAGNAISAGGQFDFARNGTLVYLSGRSTIDDSLAQVLVRQNLTIRVLPRG